MNNLTFGKLAWWGTCSICVVYVLDLWTEYATHRWHLDSGHAHLIFQFDTLLGQAALVALGVTLALAYGQIWQLTSLLLTLWVLYCGWIVRAELRHERYCAGEVRMLNELYKDPEMAATTHMTFFDDVRRLGCSPYDDIIPRTNSVKYWRSWAENHIWMFGWPVTLCVLVMLMRMVARSTARNFTLARARARDNLEPPPPECQTTPSTPPLAPEPGPGPTPESDHDRVVL